MIKKIHHKKQYIVILLLTAFASVFVCDGLCDLGLISWGNSTAIVEKPNHRQKDGHGHHDDAISDHHNDNEHEHQAAEEEECCDEIVNNLFASLIKYELKQNAVEIPVYHLLYHVYTINVPTETLNQKPLLFLYTNLPPPVTGYDIRVFIQSFLN
jgi:hypothetical protein